MQQIIISNEGDADLEIVDLTDGINDFLTLGISGGWSVGYLVYNEDADVTKVVLNKDT